jgi:2-dehydro-3-deoxyphosphooctonate aldolase (KDO 8-P synthase)
MTGSSEPSGPVRSDFTLIAGPCVIESGSLCLQIATHLAELGERFKIQVVFKASFDKANRTSGSSFRGPGLQEGLHILERVRQATGLAVLTDVHECNQVKAVAETVDVIQVPAFLCRQTDLLHECATMAKNYGRTVNVKKGQFMAAAEMAAVREKLYRGGPIPVWLTERGNSFGYHNLVVDFRNLPQLKGLGCKVFFDATHSVQQPGALGHRSGGQPQFIESLSRAAAAVGIDGLFMEVHPEPNSALSDAGTMFRLEHLSNLIDKVLRIQNALQAPSSQHP